MFALLRNLARQEQEHFQKIGRQHGVVVSSPSIGCGASSKEVHQPVTVSFHRWKHQAHSGLYSSALRPNCCR